MSTFKVIATFKHNFKPYLQDSTYTVDAATFEQISAYHGSQIEVMSTAKAIDRVAAIVKKGGELEKDEGG